MNVTIFASMISAVLFSGAALADGTQPIMLPAPISDVFVPHGFDDNDNVEIIIHGHFSNSCYRTGPAVARVDEDTREITVMARSYLYANASGCVEMTVPFTQSIKLGNLEAGQYKIVTINGTETSNLVVASAPSAAADDYLYAPVDFVNFIPQADNPHRFELTIAGNFPKMPDGCLKMKDVVTVFSPQNVLIVLPIMEKLPSQRCDETLSTVSSRFEFSKAIEVEKKGHYLVHVRSISGESRNLVLEIF